MWKFKRTKITLKKKNKALEFIVDHCTTYYKAVAIKAMLYWHKDRQIDQWNTIEILEIDLYLLS